MLREAARVLADDLDKRVVVVDTSNEIAGDGDIPHPAIGQARRMQVRTPALQHAVMIEAVENHMPQVIVIDEIGTELEAQAARTIAERGVQLIGTAHGNNLDNLMLNPTLSDLIGGIQSVTLGDEEARRRRTQKSVLERKAPPTFDVVVEIQDRDRVMVHADVADTVDALLRGDAVAPELRWRDEAGRAPLPGPAAAVTARAAGGASGSPASSAGRAGAWSPAGAAEGPGRGAPWDADGRGVRPGYRQRTEWGVADPRASAPPGGPSAVRPGAACPASGSPGAMTAVSPAHGARARRRPTDPFVAGDIADRGPLERGSVPPAPEPRARDAREMERQREWRAAATRAIEAIHAEEGTGPANVADMAAEPGPRRPHHRRPRRRDGRRRRGARGSCRPRITRRVRPGRPLGRRSGALLDPPDDPCPAAWDQPQAPGAGGP